MGSSDVEALSAQSDGVKYEKLTTEMREGDEGTQKVSQREEETYKVCDCSCKYAEVCSDCCTVVHRSRTGSVSRLVCPRPIHFVLECMSPLDLDYCPSIYY